MKNNPARTPMLKKYMFIFFLRLSVFIAAMVMYITDKPLVTRLMTQPVVKGITIVHILWLIFMIIMITHIFPTDRLSMAARKAHNNRFRPDADYSELRLMRFVKDQNIKAWSVMLVWLCVHAGVGIIYLMKILDDTDLFMLSVFYFLSDYICILFYCPFQSNIMKNRCCVNCRIYDWGHFMMFIPMLFIRNFFSWSLFFTSCVVLIRWEITYAKYPERFWYGSNKNLRCPECKDKICRYKLTKLKNQD